MISVKLCRIDKQFPQQPLPQYPSQFRLREEHGDTFFVKDIFQGDQFKLLKKMVLRHAPNLRESQGAILGQTLVNECSTGFDQTVNWTFDEEKTCLQKRDQQDSCLIVSRRNNEI